MKGFALTHRGCEEFAAMEIEEKLKTKCQLHKSIVIFDVKNELDLCKLCYTGQSIIRAGLFLAKGKTKDLEKIDIDFSKYLKEDDHFKVLCLRKDAEKQRSEIEESLGEIIINYIQSKKGCKQKVSLGNPNIIFFCFLTENEYFFGIDFAGIDLSKREYKIFTNPMSLKGTMAFSLLKFADYKKSKKQNIVDIMSGDGVIMIEAGLYATNHPVHFFDKDKLIFNKISFIDKAKVKKLISDIDKKIDKEEKQILGLDNSLRNVKAARKNSKIAGTSKTVSFSKIDIDWLDIKLKEKSIDKIISQLPSPSKNIDDKELKKTYDETFYQAEYIIKKGGSFNVVMRKKEMVTESAKKYGFKLQREKEVWAGEQPLFFIEFLKES